MDKDSVQDFIKNCSCNVETSDYMTNIDEQINKIKSDPNFNLEIEKHKALSHESRYLIYELIKNNKVCTCVLSQALELSQGTITHHVKKLIDAGLVFARKEGYFTVFYTRENLMDELS